MPNQVPETITKYEVLFALRTGVTILLPKTPALDNGEKAPVSFKVSPDNPQDIIVNAGKTIVLKNLKKEHLDAAIKRGFIMFYETKNDAVVRNTLCNYQKN